MTFKSTARQSVCEPSELVSSSLLKVSRNPPRMVDLLKYAGLSVVTAQAGAIIAVHLLDNVRKSRVPGGQSGFPTLPPEDTKVEDNEVRTYVEGRSLYKDMLKAIREAKDTIYFETYAWRSDSIGRLFKDELYAAADRGVKVYVVFDGFGTLNSNPWFRHFSKHPNLQVHKVPEIRIGLLLADIRRTGRTHRKTLVVDDEVGFVGGFNIGRDFGIEWRDTHIRLLGPSVQELSVGYADFWNTFRRKTSKIERPVLRKWDSPIKAAFNMPSRLLFPVRGLYIDAMERAQKTIRINSAYFIPDKEILTALTDAAARGVDVQVMIPEYSNHILADWVAWPYYGELLAAGVKILLYRHAMIHAKTMTIDGVWSTVGTANIDRLSLAGNFEVNMQISSEEYAKVMERIFATDKTQTRELTLEQWENRGALQRLSEALLAPFRVIV